MPISGDTNSIIFYYRRNERRFGRDRETSLPSDPTFSAVRQAEVEVNWSALAARIQERLSSLRYVVTRPIGQRRSWSNPGVKRSRFTTRSALTASGLAEDDETQEW